ncbi:hypothetical protein GO003_015515 [Methylicorpusculum oleiharenae]|uniref:hypothetical protein n=1 Tax=Methylicorpusculum oleiharenae TaxID=1338687 RepID=UPI001E473A12|nr:hypothetical protein [Methylicorpusculum oleiharenae]MCD2451795.1 hypothetical protein [Methylicorpusculum oleiharenae]
MPPSAQKLMSDPENELFFSVASLWEVVIKCGLGREDFKVAIFAHPLEYAELSIFEDMRSSGIWKVANGGAEQHGSFGSELLSIF